MKFVKSDTKALTSRFIKFREVVDEEYTRSRPFKKDEDDFFWQVEQMNSQDHLNGPYGPESILDNGNLIEAERLLQKGEQLLGAQDLSTEAGREIMRNILEDSRQYLLTELGIDKLPASFDREIMQLLGYLGSNPQQFRSEFLNFLKQAQITGGKIKKNTAWVCALLKVASASLHYEMSPGLQALDAKTDKFSDWFSKQIGSKSIKNSDDLHKAKNRDVLMVKPTNQDSFQLLDIQFRAKTKFSIFSKLIRKPGDSAQTLIEDSIGARMIVREEDLGKASEWLTSELGMRHKGKGRNTSRGAQKDQDVYLTGETDDGSRFEVQISTARNLKKGESGIYDARIYKQKQKFLIQTRLFGSIPKVQYEKAIQELSKATGTHISEIQSDFEKFFFPDIRNQKNKRYCSYEHVGRMFDSPFMPERIKRRMCAQIDLRSALPDFGVTLSDQEWYEVFEDFAFPSRYKTDLEAQKNILQFLYSKSGISGFPATIKGALKILHEAAKGNKPSKIISYDQWQYVFRTQEFPKGVNSEQRLAVIDYLDEQGGFPFWVIKLSNKHAMLEVIERDSN